MIMPEDPHPNSEVDRAIELAHLDRDQLRVHDIREIGELAERLEALDRLTRERFVTHKTMLESNAEKVRLALDASEKAITKAETAMEKRLDSVNEFRGQLNDQARTFITREVFDNAMSSSQSDRTALHEDINALRLQIAGLMDREQVQDAMKVIEAAVDRNREDLGSLKNQNTRFVGIAVGISFMMSLLGVLVAIVLRLATGST